MRSLVLEAARNRMVKHGSGMKQTELTKPWDSRSGLNSLLRYHPALRAGNH